MHNLEYGLLMIAGGVRHKAKTQRQREELADFIVSMASTSHSYSPEPYAFTGSDGAQNADEGLNDFVDKLAKRYGTLRWAREE